MTKLLNKWSAAVQKSRFASNGYLLPVVIALGLGISTTGMVALQTVAQNSTTLNDQTYAQLAEEAAKAGIAAAISCIRTGDITNVAWTTLTPNSDCKSAINANKPATVHADAVDNITSTYSVAAPTQPTQTTMLINSTGTVSIRTSAGVTVKTISKTARSLAKVVVTPASPGTSGPRNYEHFSRVANGQYNACGLARPKQGAGHVNAYYSLWCWGRTDHKVLGDPYLEPGGGYAGGLAYPQPRYFGWTAFGANTTHRYISVGANHACSSTDSPSYNPRHRIFCWGMNSHGQLGNGLSGTPYSNSSTPYAVQSSYGLNAAIAYNNFTCAVADSTYQILCWGQGYGVTPQVVNLSGSNNMIFAGLAYHPTNPNVACSLTFLATWGNNYRVHCWGGPYGMTATLVFDFATNWYAPGAQGGFSNTNYPNAGYDCYSGGYPANDDATIPRSTLFCRGTNNFGQLANGTTVSSGFYQESPYVLHYYNDPGGTPGTPGFVTYNGHTNF